MQALQEWQVRRLLHFETVSALAFMSVSSSIAKIAARFRHSNGMRLDQQQHMCLPRGMQVYGNTRDGELYGLRNTEKALRVDLMNARSEIEHLRRQVSIQWLQ